MDKARLYPLNEQITRQFLSLSRLSKLSRLCEELLQFKAYVKKHKLSKANVLRKAVRELFERDEKEISNCEISSPDLEKCSPYKDFGKGIVASRR